MARITIVCGHYGTGKSEFSINLAMRLAGDGGLPVVLVDLDVVNPYFRSREAREVLEKNGVRVVGNSLGLDTGVDLPAIPATAGQTFSDDSVRVVVDLGGDPAGARALRQFRPRIPTEDTELLYIVNVNRPETKDAPSALRFLHAISETLELRVTGVVNNSHMLSETLPEHILAGDRVCKEIAERERGIEVRYVAGTPGAFDQIGPEEVAGERVVLTLFLRPAWMAQGNIHLARYGGFDD